MDDTDTTAALVSQIDAYLVATGTTQTAFGRDFSNDPALMTRLRNGGSVTLRTADRLRAYMRARTTSNGAAE